MNRQPGPNRRSVLPTRADRDHLLHVVYGDDPQPNPCAAAGHTDPKGHRDCPTCKAVCQWRNRMYRRFNERGLKLSFDDRAYDDPEPPRCPHGHSGTPAQRKDCQECRTYRAWQDRERWRMRRAGVDRVFTDWDALTAHLTRLRAAGMIAEDIARAAQCGASTVRNLLRGTDGRLFVRIEVAQRILAVAIPERQLHLIPNASGALRRYVDATGTHRRIRAASRAGHSITSQARRIGWSNHTVRGWLKRPTVQVDAAEAVAALYPTLIAEPGADPGAATVAARKGWTAAKYFSASNIDDPSYDPFALIDNPVGVHRQLRALAWMGQGPREVAALIGEPIGRVRAWLDGGPAPAYARHMVDDAFERLSGRFGPDERIARRARRQSWAPPLAWHDIDVHNPRSRPLVNLPPRDSESAYPLESQVLQALLGVTPAGDLLQLEKDTVVRCLHQSGWSDRRIAAWLRWNPTGDLDKGANAVGKFRERQKITGAGTAVHGADNLDTRLGLVVVPSAA